MGYYTYFTLNTYGPEGDEDKLLDFEPSEGEFSCPDCIDNLIQGTPDSWKWYDWEKDMENLAKMFPTILFVLDGYGEEQDDIWQWRAKGELTEFHRMEMPPFTTPELLK